MYESHFGLKQLPFSLTPNTEFYFGLPSHREAMEVLFTALSAGEGFIKVTGEVGTGKTLLCRKLLNEMPAKMQSAYIPNPYLSPSELRRAVAEELNVSLKTDDDQQAFSQKIERKLVALAKSGKAVVLVIDEAQALPDESLEALRLMTNLETETKKLLQVVLFGQPELDEKLSQSSLRQLKQRITFSYRLNQMDAHQIEQYVQHRLHVAGFKGQPPFSYKVCKSISKVTNGTARLVNIICHKALMLAYGEGKFAVSPNHIALAARDTESANLPRLSSTPTILTIAITALTMLVLLCFWLVIGSDS